MSRSYSSYDADWQRRKSVLIRSLFHDIPILSPVEEESNDSSQDYYVPSRETFPSPPRPYSPLPPLIIEKVPIANKHDEPEDYYNKLYYKIKRIYKNLFIEKRNFGSIDYDSNYNDSSVNDSDGSVENLDFHFLESNDNAGNDNYPDEDNFDSIIEDDERDAIQSSATTKSDGYGADFESMDTAIIDVVNYTPSNEEGLIVSEEEEPGSESIDGDNIRNDDSDSSTSSDNKESSRDRIDYPEFRGREESRHSIIDDHVMTEGAESNEHEDEQSYEKEGLDNENIDGHDIIEETSQTGESDTIRINNLEFSGGEESHHSSNDDHEKSESEESNKIEDEPQPNNVTQRKLHLFVKEIKSKDFEKTASEDSNELIESNVEPMEAEVESSDSSEGPVYRQITTAAMVHYDGTQDAEERESQVYEDSAKSVILPTWSRRVVFRRNDDVDDRIEVLQISEDNADSNSTPPFNTDENESTEEDFEEVATQTLEAKEESITETRATEHEEDDEQMSTPRLDAPAEDGEEMTTPQPESPEDDVKGIGSPQAATRNEETEEGNPLPEAPVEDVEGMSTPRLGALEEDDAEMTTSQARSAKDDVKEMGSPQSDATDNDTKATEIDVEDIGTSHPIEQMRTPRPNLSHETIPITHRSHSESTSEHTAAPQEHTALTSSSQDGADHMSEIQTSNDMNEILTSIFNESRNKDGTAISGRKRKLVDKSVQAVQTSRVTWEEMRANFFVGTPKIFRLCACTDHICY